MTEWLKNGSPTSGGSIFYNPVAFSDDCTGMTPVVGTDSKTAGELCDTLILPKKSDETLPKSERKSTSSR